MEPSGSGSQLKRPRAPLSDSEDNVFSSSGACDRRYCHILNDTVLKVYKAYWFFGLLKLSMTERNDGQKRQRLDRAGQENLSPTTSSGRSTEQALRPDTPAINSVRSRVQQLTQRREGKTLESNLCTQTVHRLWLCYWQPLPQLRKPSYLNDLIIGLLRH